jgi:hypothetical protein
MKVINYLFNVEKFIKNEALFVQSLDKYFWKKKQIVYQAKKLCMLSLFVFVILFGIIMLGVILLSVILLSVILFSINMLSVTLLGVTLLGVIVPKVTAPEN